MADDASHFNESEVLAELFANVTQEQDMMGGTYPFFLLVCVYLIFRMPNV